MSTWTEIESLLRTQSLSVADEFYVTSLEEMEHESFEFDGTVICLDVKDQKGSKSFTNRGTVQDIYPLDIYIIQNQETDDSEADISSIFSACNVIAGQLLYNLNEVFEDILPVQNANISRVRNVTGNVWAGVLMNISLATECNR
jgi:hypothetical protein